MAEPRVLHVNDQAGWGGGELQTLLLIEELEGMGVENHALVRRGGLLDRRLSTLLPKGRIHRLPAALWGLAPLAVRLLRSRVELVHAHTGRAVLALAGAGSLPSVAHRRIPDPPSRAALGRLSRASRVLCVSREILHRLENLEWPGGRRPSLVCVPSAAQLPGTPPRPLALQGVPVVGFMGHFRHHKGLDLLLKALPEVMEAHPGLVLHLAGEGAEEEALRDLSKALHGSVLFHGLPEDAATFLSALDLFVMPSREEGLGSVALLAQGLGVPVLATRAGGIPEGVRHGETGWLVEASSVDALREGLLHALSDGERLRAWGAAGPPWISQTFSAGRMAQRTLDIYLDLLDRP